ncbi:MAG: ATP-binding protein [Hyphomonadaceae bacterium]
MSTTISASAEALDALGLPGAILGDDGCVREASRALRVLLGEVDPIGRKLDDCLQLCSIDWGGEAGARAYLIAGGEDEAMIWVRACAWPGAADMVVITDVSAEWRCIEAHMSKEGRYGEVMRIADVGLWSVNPDTMEVFVSETLVDRYPDIKRTLGFDEFKSYVHAEDQEHFIKCVHLVMEEGGSHLVYIRTRISEGKWRHNHVELCAGRQSECGRFEVIALSLNVTPLAEAHMRAARLSERLERTLEAVNAGAFEIDLKTGKRWRSARFEALVRLDQDALTKAEVYEIYHPDDRERAKEHFDAMLSGRSTEGVELRLNRPGEDFWIETQPHVDFDEDGRPVRITGMLLDINRRKRQEAELIQARRVAEAAAIAKSNFLASMSHEIRTPLHGVLGMAQVIHDEAEDEKQKERAGIILESGHLLNSILNDVLDLSKIEAGRMDISPGPVNMRNNLVRAMQLFEMRATERGLQLKLECDEETPEWVSCDPVRVRQCFNNLLSNAIKFTEKGGVTVRLSSERAGDGRRIYVAVQDTGIGLDASAISRLFAPFTQADGSTTRKFGGTGLGLSIARRLARLMGGDISVSSTPGMGSEFVLSFLAGPAAAPAASEAETGRDTNTREAQRRLSGSRILVVDDNPVNRQVARIFLEPVGVHVVDAADGASALQILSTQPVDLVLLDLHMPVMDGRETINRIRNSGAYWSKVPVIMLTADAISAERAGYRSMGMDDYVSKPVDPRELITRIVMLLSGVSRHEPEALAS